MTPTPSWSCSIVGFVNAADIPKRMPATEPYTAAVLVRLPCLPSTSRTAQSTDNTTSAIAHS